MGTLSFPGQGPLEVEDIHSKPQHVSKQSFIHSLKMFMKHVRVAILLLVWDTDITYKIFYDVPPVPCTGLEAYLFLGILNSFLASVQKALLPGTCLTSFFHRGLNQMSHPQRYFPWLCLQKGNHFLSLSVSSSCFIFHHNTYYHLSCIYLLSVFLHLTIMNVHESRIFALLTVGTMCLEQHLTQSRHLYILTDEWTQASPV